jgi:hypothetical protein
MIAKAMQLITNDLINKGDEQLNGGGAASHCNKETGMESTKETKLTITKHWVIQTLGGR